MVAKKGFMRIMEATIAVLIILGVLFVIASQREVRSNQDLTEILRALLDDIAKDQELRQQVVEYNLSVARNETPNREILGNLSVFLEEKIKNPAFNHSISICKANETCPLQVSFPVEDPQDIYAAERIITTTLSQGGSQELKKIKLFLWRRV